MLYYAYVFIAVVAVVLFITMIIKRDPYIAIASAIANAIVFASSLKVDVPNPDGTVTVLQDNFLYHLSMAFTVISVIVLFLLGLAIASKSIYSDKF